MGLFRHSLSIFGGDYVICRIFLQSARMVVIRRTYNVLGGAWVGIRAYPLERLVSAIIKALEGTWDELFVGTPDLTLAGEAFARVAEKRSSTKFAGRQNGRPEACQNYTFPTNSRSASSTNCESPASSRAR